MAHHITCESGRHKLTGTRHEGLEWTQVVRRLRSATLDAAAKASWRPRTQACRGTGRPAAGARSIPRVR